MGLSSWRSDSRSMASVAFWNFWVAEPYFLELAAWSPFLSRIFASSREILPRQYSRLMSEALISLLAKSFSSSFLILSDST